MRKFPKKKTEKQKLIIEATKDYFREANQEENKSITKTANYLMNRKRGLETLTEGEEGAVERIRENLKDNVYISSLILAFQR